MSSSSSQSQTPNDELVCRPSKWFYRRIALLAILTGGLAIYFLYDGSIGYPKRNFTVDLHEAFEAGQTGGSFEAFVAEKEIEEAERTDDLKKAHSAGGDGATWAGFAAQRMLPEKVPERYTEADIREQFYCAIFTGVITLIVILFGFWQSRKSFRYDGKAVSTPKGKSVAVSDVVSLNLEKWDRGIAHMNYRNDGSEEESIRLDDYKYQGIGRMLLELCEKNPGIQLVGEKAWLEVTAGEDVRENLDAEVQGA